jgi:hypothetical protein
MIKIYALKTKKVREVILDPGEAHYLCKENLKRIKAHNDKKKEKQ